jgi:uncharacterized protein YjbI with pentapeptide repeats
MKILKAPRFSFLFKPFMQRQKVELVVTMLNFIPFRKPEEPMLEEEAWPSIGAQLGDVPLDVGDFKATGEWLAYGSAYAGALKEAGNIDVSVSINKKKKCLRVFGEREWIAQVNKPISMTDPIPFSSMPIIPSFAYGGREFKDNPAGIGHWDAKQESDRYLLPRIMYPESIMNAPEDTLLPGYFSSRDIMLPERQQYAGTYDELWAETSFPGFPDDFNPRMNQLAQEDQHLETFFSGFESFDIENMHPDGPEQSVTLPGIRGRVFITILRNGLEETFEEIPLVTDTVSLFPGLEMAVVHHRGKIEVESMDFKEVLSMIGGFEWMNDPPRSIDYYRICRDKRVDFDTAAEAYLEFSELYPLKWKEPPDKILEIIKPRDPSVTSDGTPQLDAMWSKWRGILDAGLANEGLSYDEISKIDPLSEEGPEIKEIKKEMENLKNHPIPKTGKELYEKGLGEGRLFGLLEAYGDDELDAVENNFRRQCAFFGYDYDELKAKGMSKGPKSLGDVKGFVNAELARIIDDENAPVAIRDAARKASPGLFSSDYDAGIQKLEELKKKQKSVQGHFLPRPPDLSPGASSDLREKLLKPEGLEELDKNNDFRGADLSGIDFSGMNLKAADFTAANLTGAIFNTAQLSESCFVFADLTDALFEDADLRQANFGEAIVDRTSFAKSLMDETNFTGAKGVNTLFVLAKLKDAKFHEVNLTAPELMGCELINASFVESSIKEAWFNHANLNATKFINCKMANSKFFKASGSNTVLVGVDASQSNFDLSVFESFLTCDNVNLNNCTFKSSKFSMSNFRGSSLKQGDFTGAELIQTDFSETTLHGSVFCRAFARECRFHRADIESVDFDGADLMDSNFLLARIKNCQTEKTNFFNADFTKTKIENVDFGSANVKRTRLEGFRFK